MLLGRIARRRHQDGDEGTIAILAAVIIPVILVVIALALSTMVWSSSETEVQRAADQAALKAAASSLLLNYDLPTATTLNSATLPFPTPLGKTLTPCATAGDALTSTVGLTTGVLNTALGSLGLPSSLTSALSSLPTSCPSSLKNIQLPGALTTTARDLACQNASSNLSKAAAPYTNNFYAGSDGDPVPTCTQSVGGAATTGANGRVNVTFGSNSPLLGLDSTVSAGPLSVNVPTQYSAIQAALAALGVHLDSALPNLDCPTANVTVTQPVKGPFGGSGEFGRVSTPNGEATAERLIKNAVVVPVFNGVGALASPVPINLNSILLQGLQQYLLNALDQLNTTINNVVSGLNIGVSRVTGALTTVTGGAVSASATVGPIDLLKCLKETVSDLYDPNTNPNENTVNDVLSQAATAQQPIMVIEVGVQGCAKDIVNGVLSPADALTCVAPALKNGANGLVNTLTGLYDIPFLDVVPALIEPISSGNYAALPVAVTQAAGAFRAVLVRNNTNARYTP